MHEQHQAGLRERRHRLEMVLEPIFEILGQTFVHGAAEQRHVQRVAVGLGARHRLDRQVATRAAAVLDIDLLAEHLAQLGADHPADDVARAAGGEPDHQANGLGRVGCLRSRDIGRRARQRDHGCRQGDARKIGANNMQSATQQAHRFLPEDVGPHYHGAGRGCRDFAPRSPATFKPSRIQASQHYLQECAR